MLDSSRRRILGLLNDDALVLDVGGGGQPFERADWVLDLLPYERRGLYAYEPAPERERFTASTWVQRDMCDRQPWPFSDGQFDYAVCSHTLEDVRDPLWVCSELMRVARAGYIEVPSRLEEQSYGFQGPWVGWGHHRWLIDVEGQELTFVFKHHILHARPDQHFPSGFRDRLSEEQRVSTVFWQGRFSCTERVFFDGPSVDSYLSDYVTAHADVASAEPGSGRVAGMRRAARALRRR